MWLIVPALQVRNLAHVQQLVDATATGHVCFETEDHRYVYDHVRGCVILMLSLRLIFSVWCDVTLPLQIVGRRCTGGAGSPATFAGQSSHPLCCGLSVACSGISSGCIQAAFDSTSHGPGLNNSGALAVGQRTQK